MAQSAFYIFENESADQLHGVCAANQRFLFRYIDRIIPILPEPDISSL